MTIFRIIVSIAVLFISLAGYTNAFGSKYSQMRDVVVPIIVTEVSDADKGPSKESLTGSGSGVVIGPTYILTAAHLIDTNGTYKLYRFISQSSLNSLKIIKIDRKLDLMLLSSNAVKCPCATFSRIPPNIDDNVYTVGFPIFTKYWTQIVSPGIMQGSIDEKFVTSNVSAPGSSGGALFIEENNSYRWVGIIDEIGLYDGQMQNWMTFSITNNSIVEFLKDTTASQYAR